MKMKITGRGNFDGVTAPVLTDPAGWRTYPASTKFDPDDPVNVTGTKTFEMAVIPETKKVTMPVFQFSYFDPGTEKYVTSTSQASPLTVEGEAPPAPSVGNHGAGSAQAKRGTAAGGHRRAALRTRRTAGFRAAV